MMKRKLLAEIYKTLDKKIEDSILAIESAKESRDNETKSSVGDKYETGRTLMQQEVEKNRVQLNKTELLKKELQKIDPHKKYSKVEFGSLVQTSERTYFVAAAIGKVSCEAKNYFCISLASPIGKMLNTKCINDTITFQGKTETILNIF